MDPTVKNYLMQKYGQSVLNPPAPLPFMLDPANQIPADDSQQVPSDPSAPPQAPPPPTPNDVPKLPPVSSDIGVLGDDELKRYGVRSPEQIEALRQQRLQMGNDLANQAGQGALVKMLAQANDQVNNTGNRILAGNQSNTAPAVGNAFDEALKGQQNKVQAFDDANEKVGESDYKRLADIDDKRLKIQQMREASKDRAADRAALRESTQAWRESQHTDKLSKQDEDMQKKYGDALNFDKASSRSPLGMASNNIVRAKNVLGLLSKPVTGPDRHLIANDLNTMVSGLSNVTGAQASQYNAMAARAKDMINNLEGDTKNTLPEEQRLHMQQQIRDLYNNMAAVIKSHKKIVDIGFKPLLGRHPELAQQYDQQINDAIGLGNQAGTSPDEDRAAVEWAQKNPGDPRATEILLHNSRGKR